MTKEELQARRAAAQARAAAAALTDDERDEAALLQEEADAIAEARTNEAKRRAILGKRLEAESRTEAAGAYHVEFFDLGKLLPDADPARLPGRGVLVVRSHTTASKRAFDRDVEHKNGEGAKPLGEIFADLVCANVVRPVFFDGAGKPVNAVEALAFRAFLESDLGNGCPSQIGAAILRLGGAVAVESKRAT
jgi:hypothetical protein